MHTAEDSQQHTPSSNTRGRRPGTDFRQVDTIRPMDAPGGLERRLFACDLTGQTPWRVAARGTCPVLTPSCTYVCMTTFSVCSPHRMDCLWLYLSNQPGTRDAEHGVSFPGHGLENAPSLASGAFFVVELKTVAMGMQPQANTHGAFNAFFKVAE